MALSSLLEDTGPLKFAVIPSASVLPWAAQPHPGARSLTRSVGWVREPEGYKHEDLGGEKKADQ